MKKILQSFLSFIVLAIAIVSCGGGNPLIKEGQKGIKSKNFDAAISALNQAIDEEPANAEAYYYRGIAYAEKASNNSNVSMRQESYFKMRESLDKAQELYAVSEKKNVESTEADLLIERKWASEHNLAIQYITNDSTAPPVDKPLEVAESHLINAITINPDSLLSYDVLAEVYRLNGKVDDAISTLETIMKKRSTPDSFDYDRLSSYYIQKEEYDKAKNILIEGIDIYPDSVSLVQKLADSYMNLGMRNESIEVIESLIERDPTNPQYHLVLGIQVFTIANDINEELSPIYSQWFDLQKNVQTFRGSEKKDAESRLAALESNIEEKESVSNRLTKQAISEFKQVIKYRPEDASVYNSLGIVYQNTAASLFEKRNAILDNDKAAVVDDEAKENLRQAMTNYERATEFNPDNQEYWRALFQVYTTLGMMDKAEAAMKKAGM